VNIRLIFAYNPCMGEMKRANAYEEERRLKDRFASTLVIAASIIAAVRLARDENITRSSPSADDLGEGVELGQTS